ncbi:MAG: multiheme c-type cytochrome, partial [Candidatus Promineifilaceae bacterium]
MRRIESLYALFIVLLFLAALVLPLTTKDGIPHVFAGPVEGAASGEALVPSTPQDFVMPGSQPETLTTPLGDPSRCMGCHAIYGIPPEQSPEQRTWQAWQGSMMAQAGRDPLFFAALDVANAGAANAGEFCLRCHMPRGWLAGRSSTPDASEMTAEDQEGVQCEVCHRLVDPVPDPANPARDEQILAALDQPVVVPGSSQMIVDPEDFRRGPFNIMADLGLDVDPHLYTGGTTAVSPFHQDSALCGTCHDINNPMFTWNEASQTYVPNELDAPADIAEGFPIERTYSEWLLSDFSTPPGIELPKFGGNNALVSTCQDCHMRAITGSGGGLFGNNGFVRD